MARSLELPGHQVLGRGVRDDVVPHSLALVQRESGFRARGVPMPEQAQGGPGRRRDRAPHDPQQAVDVAQAEGVPHFVNRGVLEE